MPRILTRPLFRKGGLSKTPRPSYRGGGVTAIRPGYRGGGRMTGIMSGITPRRDYDNGGGVFPVGGKMHRFAESPIGGGLMYGVPGALADMFYTPGNLIGRAFGFNPGWSARKDIREQKDLLFGKDREGRMTDEEVERSNFLGIPFKAKSWRDEQKEKIEAAQKKQKKSEIAASTGTGTGEGAGEGAGTGQSDLESLQDYMKMFEAAAGRPSTKSKWLELAKFGSNLMAQPGGDLVGAVGRAATPSLEGLSKEMAADRAAKQSARLMGLKAGLEKTDTGEFGKKIRTLAKLTNKSEKSIAEKFLTGDTDFDAEYLAAAEAAGVELGEARKIYLENIKTMSDKNPDIAAKLNKPFPKKNPVEGEYYVLPGGQFTRWVDGEKLKPTDPGFYDKEA